jgi:2-C-methyl-D-erythritol 4-phosphate cytidylyltransferase
MKIIGIIVAGGTGSRMNSTIPKQFLPIMGKPMLYYSIQAFIKAFENPELVVVVHPAFKKESLEILSLFNYPITLIDGGETRYHSVQNGIQAIKHAHPKDIVLVHDAARPAINDILLNNLVKSVAEKQITIPVWPIAESIRKKTGPNSSVAVDRNELFSVQTPQAAFYLEYKTGFDQPYESFFTDEATVLENTNCTTLLIDGLGQNIKVTTADQMELMEQF